MPTTPYKIFTKNLGSKYFSLQKKKKQIDEGAERNKKGGATTGQIKTNKFLRTTDRKTLLDHWLLCKKHKQILGQP